MARYGAILDFGRALMNGDAVHDGGVGIGPSARPAHKAAAPEMTQKLLLQYVTRLNEEASIDGLVRHPHETIMRERTLKANGNLTSVAASSHEP
jgi:hypothetical protein